MIGHTHSADSGGDTGPGRGGQSTVDGDRQNNNTKTYNR